MYFTNKLSIFSYLFLFVVVFGYAKESIYTSFKKNTTTTTLSEEAIYYYGQKVKSSVFTPDPSKEIIKQEISGVPFGLTFDPSTGILEGVVDIEEDKTYPFENFFSVDLQYNDGTTLTFTLSILINISFPIPSLVDSVTGSYKRRLATNDTINYVTDGTDIAIRASGNFEFGDFFFRPLEKENSFAVDFFLNGNYFKRENVAPFALNGDVNGRYNPLSLKEGTYALGTRLYSKSLGKYVSDLQEIVVTIINPVDQIPVINGIKGNLPRFLGSAVNFSIDATDSNGLALIYSAIDLPEGLSLDPETGSITGTLDLNKTDSSAKQFIVEVSNGTYSDTLEIQIPQLQEPVINAITIMNAITDQPIKGFENIPVDSRNQVGVTLELIETIKEINVVAHTNIGAIAGGVIDFTIDNKFFRRESVAPYALAGDLSGNYLKWNYPQDQIAERGFQLVNATATIKKSNSLQTIGASVALTLVLIPNNTAVDADEIIKGLTLSPNPATEYIDINNLSPDRELGLFYQIVDVMTGRGVKEGPIGFTSSRIDISALSPGMYTIIIATESGISLETFMTKFVKQ